MCLAVPGRVVCIKGGNCMVDVLGALREASLELLDGVNVGDYVLVHAGCAIQKLDKEEALKTLELCREVCGLSDGGLF